MHLVPRSTLSRVAVLGILIALVTVALWQRQTINDVYTYFFPGGPLEAAAERTSPPAPVENLDRERLPGIELIDPAPTGDEPSIALKRVLDLESPSAVVDPAGPGPVLVTGLEGQVLAADLDTGTTEILLDLSDRVSTGGERGLLGMALDPAEDRLYLNFTNSRGDTEIRSWAMLDGVPAGDDDDGVLHLTIGQPFRNHNGGHLAFGPDGLLWIGVGDGGSANDPGGVAQNPDVILGSMLRVHPDPGGGVVAPMSNPDLGGRPEIWAIGLRNPWRYSFDRATGQLWVADVGQDQVEEVTVVDPNAQDVNFGWDRVEGTRPFDGEPGPELTDPVVEYTHDEGCSITGGYVYRGDDIPSLHGWYLFGDFCGGWIRAVPADDPTASPTELVADAGPGISFGELEDGELLFLTGDGIDRIVGT